MSDELKHKLSLIKKGKPSPLKGIKFDEFRKSRMNISGFSKGHGWNRGLIGYNAGEKNCRWIADRSKLKKQNRRNDSAYKDWRKQIWKRDNFKCKFSNQDCSGRLETHHILRWIEYPELRYEVNNGILLCKFHHPRTKNKENELINDFRRLIDNYNK